MREAEALARMVAPGTRRPGKFREGVIQVRLTRACNLACYSCTQGSQLAGPTDFMTALQFEQAVLSLKGYFGVVGVFGGNPCTSPHFVECCDVLRHYFPREQCGLWCNDLLTPEKGAAARATFDPRVSNLNVHLDRRAFERFGKWWPEARPFGLDRDSRHCPPFVALKDVLKKPCSKCNSRGVVDGWREVVTREESHIYQYTCPECNGQRQLYDKDQAWDLISRCDVNQHWSAAIILFRGQLRAFFCEVAAAIASLHQDEPDYPDTGLDLTQGYGGQPWWQLPMRAFADQVRLACHSCGIPLRGYGQLAQGPETQTEQVSPTHAAVFRSKRRRPLELVTSRDQVHEQGVPRMIDYLQNASR